MNLRAQKGKGGGQIGFQGSGPSIQAVHGLRGFLWASLRLLGPPRTFLAFLHRPWMSLSIQGPLFLPRVSLNLIAELVLSLGLPNLLGPPPGPSLGLLGLP